MIRYSFFHLYSTIAGISLAIFANELTSVSIDFKQSFDYCLIIKLLLCLAMTFCFQKIAIEIEEIKRKTDIEYGELQQINRTKKTNTTKKPDDIFLTLIKKRSDKTINYYPYLAIMFFLLYLFIEPIFNYLCK